MDERKWKVEIVEFVTDEVVKTFAADGTDRRTAERIDDGLTYNLDHEHFFTRIVAA